MLQAARRSEAQILTQLKLFQNWGENYSQEFWSPEFEFSEARLPRVQDSWPSGARPLVQWSGSLNQSKTRLGF